LIVTVGFAETVSVSDEVLLPAVESVGLVIVAVLVWLVFVEAGTVYCAVTVAVVPAAIVPSAQVKFVVLVVVSHVPLVVVTVPRVKPVGQVSARLTESASDGPAFETEMV
jgi:hypothetical protein